MRFLAAAVLSLAVSGLARPARACGSIMWREQTQTHEQRYVTLIDEAQAAEQLGDSDTAARLIRQVFADPTFRSAPPVLAARAHRTAARLAMTRGQYATAETHFAIAVKTLPELTGQYARAMVKGGHIAEARKELAVWEQRGLRDAFGLMASAEVRLLDGDRAGALTAVDGALKLLPHDAAARKLRLEIERPSSAAVAIASTDAKVR